MPLNPAPASVSRLLARKRTLDLLMGCPKLPEQAKNQKSFCGHWHAPLKIHQTNISPATLLITMAHRPLPLCWPAFLSPSTSPFCPELHQTLAGAPTQQSSDAVSSESDGALWVLWWALHAALATVNFSFFLGESLHVRIVAWKIAAGPAPTPRSWCSPCH